MLTLYYPPFRAETDEELLRQTLIALQRYVIELSALDLDTLESRWGDCLRAHRVERWPVIAAIMGTDSSGENRTAGYMAGVDSREERKQVIEDLLTSVLWNGELGQQAAKEGWADSLRIFIRENAAVPDSERIAKMRGGEAQASACMAGLERQHDAGEEVSGIVELRKIRQGMLIRNARLGEQIMKGDRPAPDAYAR